MTPSTQANTELPPHLLTNPDYIALTHTLSLLKTQRARAEDDIQTLVEQRREAIADPEIFIASLHRSGDGEGERKGRVEPQKIAKAPHIEWSKYGVEAKGLEKAVERGALRGEGVVDVSRFGAWSGQGQV
ncbi:hypothetical protein SAICODRAFT_29121 [Saitoella complicata NRRL Y-17804]|uniref:uncharacterized protein n=1 Tax=Saitoella complicata (strain BCRC 22490 / CBS 7301 / JCM 7358 / NBRC 10748 / NRRL Y-17804) TaxID=698492 RepID=UPI000867CD8A|nr:uncharacterized protein SAICODRAFT_29121 [Saitoella complicata NRRL Y-17804]ODQ54890.1 hypothetical protein SAICODRAFT_29121 [Saitoella complicata NRRL Y-17804]